MNTRPVVLLTGASGGIGAATALEFARRGYDLSITSRDEHKLQEVQAHARELGARCELHAGDISDLKFAETVVRETVAGFNRLDVLINNAAWRELLTMRQITVESWERTLRICVTAPAFLAKWSAEQMEKQGKGVIINVSSIMSTLAAGLAPAYIAAKGALDSLTYELAALYGPKGIRVVAINPGAIDTALSGDYASQQSPDDTEKRIQEWSCEMIPLGRWGKSEEIAKAMAFAASDDASYLTGTTLTIDGGWSHQLYPRSIKKAMNPEQFK